MMIEIIQFIEAVTPTYDT